MHSVSAQRYLMTLCCVQHSAQLLTFETFKNTQYFQPFPARREDGCVGFLRGRILRV